MNNHKNKNQEQQDVSSQGQKKKINISFSFSESMSKQLSKEKLNFNNADNQSITKKVSEFSNQKDQVKKLSLDGFSETAQRFLASVSSQMENMHKPYMIEYLKTSKIEGRANATKLFISNQYKKGPDFHVKIRGIGLPCYEKLILQKGDEREIELQTGTYEIVFSVEDHYISRGGDIAKDDDWMYKKRADGTNIVHSIVTFQEGQYFLGVKGELSQKGFKKLLKELEDAPYL